METCSSGSLSRARVGNTHRTYEETGKTKKPPQNTRSNVKLEASEKRRGQGLDDEL